MEKRFGLGRLYGRRDALRLGLGTVAGLALASPLLAACGDDAGADPTATEAGGAPGAGDPTATEPSKSVDSTATDASGLEPSATEAAVAEPSPTEAAGGVEISSDEFVVACALEPVDLLPWFGGYDQALIMRQIYQTLVEPRLTINANGAVEVELTPWLAESWELVEPTRWRFKLREGVKFHNGEEFNAEVAKFSYETMTDPEILDSVGKTSFLRTIEAWEVVDEYTIDVVTTIPDTELPGLSIRIGFAALPKQFIEANGIEALAETPIGTGPYAFQSWERGQQVLLSRYDDYWNPDGPNMASVRYIFREQSSVRAQTVQAGEADFAYNIGAEQAATLDNFVVGGGFQSTSIRINNQIAPTNDIRLRRAINYAIDRGAIVDAIFGGAATPLAFFGFQPVALEPFPYDPDQAAELIKDAELEGTELELVYGEGRIPEEDQLAEIYKASLEAIGLSITLTKVEPRQYNEIGGQPFEEQPPLYMETTSSGNFGEIASGLYDKYGCEGTGTFCDPDFDAEFQELQGLTGQERLDLLQSIAERLHEEETPRAWVAAVQQVHGLAANVETTFPANTYIRFDDIKVVG